MGLQFEMHQITDETAKNWDNYFSEQWQLYSRLSEFCGFYSIRRIPNDVIKSVQSMLDIYPHCISSFKSTFGDAVLNDPALLQKAAEFLEKMSTGNRISDFLDPISGSIFQNKPSVYPHGLWIAHAHLDDDVVISMLVVPSEDRKAQTHKFIFKSLNFLLKQFMGGAEPIRDIALPLHGFAAKELGCQYVITRPVHQMIRILTAAGFKPFSNEEEEKAMFGEATWNYMNKYGLSDTRYPLLSCENTLPLQSFYTSFLNKEQASGFTAPRLG